MKSLVHSLIMTGLGVLIISVNAFATPDCRSVYKIPTTPRFNSPSELRAFTLFGIQKPYTEILKLNGLEFVSERAIQNNGAQHGYSVTVRYLGQDIVFVATKDRHLGWLAKSAIEGAIRALEMTRNPRLIPSDATATAKFHSVDVIKKLPSGVQRWLKAEQERLSRDVDTKLTRGFSPSRNFQEQAFKPEAKNVFEMEGHWISEDNLLMVPGGKSVLAEQFQRIRDGKKQYMMMVHPESKSFYRDLLSHSLETEVFLATPTASSRSLLTWKPGQESSAFIAKVSLDRQIGNIIRTIDDLEIAKSMGVDAVIAGASGEFPQNVSIGREVVAFIPKGATDGGWIVRELPKEMFQDDVTMVPFFALYGTSDSQPKPLLVSMLQKSKTSTREFIAKSVIRPFAQVWVQMALKNKLVLEPHAQNALFVLDQNEMLTGRIHLRDNGGYTFDFEGRKKLGLYIPDVIPTLGHDFNEVYDPAFHATHYLNSLAKYYEGGFLSQIEIKTTEWAKQGLIDEGLPRGWSREILLSEVEREIFRLTGRPIKIERDYSNLNSVMNELGRTDKYIKSTIQRFVPATKNHGPVIHALVRYGQAKSRGEIVSLNGQKKVINDWGVDVDGQGFVQVSSPDGLNVETLYFKQFPKGAFSIRAVRLDDVLTYRNQLVIDRVMKDRNMDRPSATAAFEELKKWFFWKFRAQIENETYRPYMYSEIDKIDYVWHSFLLFTDHYISFGKRYFSTYLHHTTQSAMDEKLGIVSARDSQVEERESYVNRADILNHMRETLGEETYQAWFVRKEFEPKN